MANRLSENPATSVLVIEAGNDDRKDPRVYDIYQYTVAFNTELDWSYPTDQHKSIRAYVLVPMLFALESLLLIILVRPSCSFSGKTLGGSSSINGAAYTRGTKEQYDSWSQLLDPADQNLGWDWNGMFSYMKKVMYFLVFFLLSSQFAQAQVFC